LAAVDGNAANATEVDGTQNLDATGANQAIQFLVPINGL